MLLIIVIAVLAAVLFIVGGIICVNTFSDSGPFLVVAGIIVSVFLAILVITAIVCNIGVDGDIASNQEIYDSLIYQLENDIYDNDNDLGKSQLYADITKWNQDVARGKALQNNDWIGVFYPDELYDSLKIIDISEYDVN